MTLRKMLTLLLALVLSLSLAIPASAADGLSRGAAVQALYELEGSPAVAGAGFVDTAGKPYADAAAWAKQAGVCNGVGDDRFGGDRAILRAELVTILHRYAKACGIDVSVGEDTNILSYSDAFELPRWSVSAWQWACGAGVVEAKGDCLAYADAVTPDEFSAILLRFGALSSTAVDMIAIDVPETDGIPAHTVPAIVTLPKGEGPFPAVVMLHGTGSNKNEAGGGYDLAAPAMAEAGIATIRIDFMGNGDSTASYKDYNYTSANIDAKAAADYMAKLAEVDADKLAVMGWSQGGTNALLAAAKYPDTFKAVVTWAGALDLSTMFEDFNAAWETAKTAGSYEMTFDWRDSLPVGERWFREVSETDVLDAISGLRTPVLSIHGDMDDTVPMADSENVQKTLGTNRLCVIPGADHTYNIFAEADGATMMKAIRAGIAFLQQTLTGAVTGRVIEIEKYGHAKLDTTILGFTAAGYALGDTVAVKGGSYSGVIPYFNGYYVENGDYMLRAYPGHENIAVCINYGKFAETAGLSLGDPVTISLAEKAGALTVQEVNSLVYTNERGDYASDEAFANFRAVKMDGVGENKLFRSASPINNENKRAATANRLAEAAGVKTVMDLADTEAEIAAHIAASDFDSAYYKTLYDAGSVIVLGMPINYASDEFAAGIVKGMTFLSEHDTPYLVHCVEGKDRAGFAAMLLEMLAGAKLDDVVADYMLSYVNFYHIDPEKDAAKYQMIAEKNVMDMIRTVCGLDKGAALEGTDLSAAAANYLTAHGMSADAVAALKAKLQ